MCALHLSPTFKMIPKYFIVSDNLTGVEFRRIVSGIEMFLDLWKIMAWVLVTERESPIEESQSKIDEKARDRFSMIVVTLVPLDIRTKSSANCIEEQLKGMNLRISLTKRLNKRGLSTEPWGKPKLTTL